MNLFKTVSGRIESLVSLDMLVDPFHFLSVTTVVDLGNECGIHAQFTANMQPHLFEESAGRAAVLGADGISTAEIWPCIGEDDVLYLGSFAEFAELVVKSLRSPNGIKFYRRDFAVVLDANLELVGTVRFF